jgi:hypothetical protein
MLRMLEPKIEEDFRPFEKKRTGDKALLEEQKLRFVRFILFFNKNRFSSLPTWCSIIEEFF